MSIMSFFRPRAPAEKDTDTLPLEIPTNTLGLHILHDTKTATFDVVAVHGLGGDSYRTWTEQSEGKLWLRDFLPESDKFQSARILTFGYNAKAFVDPTVTANTLTIFTFAQNLLSDLADLRTTTKSTGRPIIFIGHSLGGLVIKSASIMMYTFSSEQCGADLDEQVLVHAQSRPKSFGDISQSTKAIFFFATPHQGADVAAWADHLGSVTKVLGLGTSEVMAELQRWSQPLLVLATMFSEQITGIIIRTFYETLKTNGVTASIPQPVFPMQGRARPAG
ncbi:hypothetical protein ACJ41O_001558 [Fusarium nematophilum]